MRPATIGGRGFLAAALLSAAVAANAVQAADVKIFDDGELALWGRESPAGVAEPAVKTYYGGALQGSFKVLEASDKVPGRSSWPLTVADLVANTYLRLTYQMAGGSSAPLGTSLVGTMSYRTAAGLQYIPSVSRADVFTGGSDRLRTVLSGQFGSDALVSSTRTFPDPPIGSTTVGVSVSFQSENAVHLDGSLLGNDAFRLVGLSSMFSSPSQHDADILRWEDPSGAVHTLRLTDTTPRDSHLFSTPMEIAPGGYFELIKEPGSIWYPESPSLRVDLSSVTGVTGRLGIQGWLAATTDPTADSLSVWLEWMDAPAVLPSGALYGISGSVTATPPSTVPPATLTWSGGASGTWDNAMAAQWLASGSARAFAQGDHVIFSDTGLTTGAVSLSGALAPGSVVVDNGVTDFTFAGTGSITGATGLVKKGRGRLALATANSYTGGTEIRAGILVVAAPNALGAGAVKLGDATGSGDASLLISGAFVMDRPITVQDDGSLSSSRILGGTNTAGTAVFSDDITVQKDLTLTAAPGGTVRFDGGLDDSAGHTITKVGEGIVVLDGVQAYGPRARLEVEGGTVDLASDAGALGANLSISVTDAALHFSADQHLETLDIGPGGEVVFTGAHMVVLNHLVIDRLDLGPMSITPEPATLLLVALGGLGIRLRRRRQRAIDCGGTLGTLYCRKSCQKGDSW